MADFINVGFGNMVNGDKIISMVSTDAAPVKRMIQNARDEGKAVDATCGRRTRTVLVMESDHLILSALTTDTLSSRCHNKRSDEEQYPKLSLKSLDTVFRFRQQPVSREKENRTEENTTLNQKMISYV